MYKRQVQKALNLNVKARAVKGAAAKENWSFLSVDKANVVLETVKKAEDGDGIIVRPVSYTHLRGRLPGT